MLQYIINSTAIWSIVLIIYYLFFRQETFHTFNRLYLSIGMLSGSILPLLTVPVFKQKTVIVAKPLTAYQQPIFTDTEMLVNQTLSSVSHHINIGDVIWMVYITGVIITFLLLLKEVVYLFSLFRGAHVSTIGNMKLVETGKHIAPFSILNYVFINRREQYNDADFSMLLKHERLHYKLVHVADLLILRVTQVLFWFHPLVYLFDKYMLMTHEYQVDNIMSAKKTGRYKEFLVEQNLLQKIPLIAHSLSYSPLKNRIMMLQKKSSLTNRYKQLLAIPVYIASVMLFTNCADNTDMHKDYATHRTGNTVSYKGNVTELKTRKPDILINKDGKTIISNWADEPISLNNMKVCTVYPITARQQVDVYPKFSGRQETLGEYLYEHLKDDFDKLDDGRYNMLFNFSIIDEHGSLAYHSYSGIQRLGEILSPDGHPYMATHMDNKVLQLLYDAPKFTPAILNGQKVPCEFVSIWGIGYNHPKSHAVVVVKNHQAKIEFKTS